MGTSSVTQIQRSPLTLTKWLWTRADGIPVDASRGDLLAAAARDGRVDAQHQRPLWRQRGYEQAQQDAAGIQARPGGPIEDAMIRLVARQVSTPHGAQGRADHPTPWGQDGPSDEFGNVAPRPA